MLVNSTRYEIGIKKFCLDFLIGPHAKTTLSKSLRKPDFKPPNLMARKIVGYDGWKSSSHDSVFPCSYHWNPLF